MYNNSAFICGVALRFHLLFLAGLALKTTPDQGPGKIEAAFIINHNYSSDRTFTRIPFSIDLPSPWKQVDIGKTIVPGKTDFDGKVFVIEATGSSPDSTADKVHFTYVTMEAEGEITIRLMPQPGLQLFSLGLIMRESLSAKSPQASLVISPRKTALGDAPAWELVQLTRGSTGEKLKIKNRTGPLPETLVTEGRLTGYNWLRLQRKFNSFYAFSSTDGKSWTSLGSAFVEMKKPFFAGIAVSSLAPNSTVKVMIDQVTIPGWSSEE